MEKIVLYKNFTNEQVVPGLKEALEEIEFLKTQKNQLERDIEQLADNISGLEVDLGYRDEEIEGKEKELTEMSIELDLVTKNFKDLESVKEDIEKENKGLYEDIEELEFKRKIYEDWHKIFKQNIDNKKHLRYEVVAHLVELLSIFEDFPLEVGNEIKNLPDTEKQVLYRLMDNKILNSITGKGSDLLRRYDK